jgi:hypothetical protein
MGPTCHILTYLPPPHPGAFLPSSPFFLSPTYPRFPPLLPTAALRAELADVARRLTGPMEEGEVAQSSCAAAHMEAGR